MSPDICVIGAGPAGIAVATAAVRAGKSVLLAESGTDGSRFGDDLNRGKVKQAVMATDRTDPALISGPSLYDEGYLVSGRIRAIGGSSRLWGVRASTAGVLSLRLARPERMDFEAVPEFDIPEWPLTFGTIAPYLDASERFFELGTQDRDTSAEGCLAFAGGELLPGFLRFSPSETIYRKRFDELTAMEAVTIRLGWTLLGLRTNHARDRIVNLVFIDGDGREHEVRPAVAVLAAGGIENCRILLNAAAGGDIVDPHDTLGRWFMDHPHVSLGILRPKRSISELGTFHDFQETMDGAILGHYSLAEAAARDRKLLRFSVSLVGAPELVASPAAAGIARLRNLEYQDLPVRDWLRTLGGILCHPADAARYAAYRLGGNRRHHTALGGWSQRDTQVSEVHLLKIEAMLAQRPSPDNRIRLLKEKDRLGFRRAALQWSWSRPEVDSYWRSVAFMKSQMEEARAGAVIEPQALGAGRVPRAGTGWHQMGGTRMSSCPKLGSVDADCRLHGIENLYVTGSSVFSSSIGYANPTLTVVALALRLGTHLGTL